MGRDQREGGRIQALSHDLFVRTFAVYGLWRGQHAACINSHNASMQW